MKTTPQALLGHIINYRSGEPLRPATIADWLRARQRGELTTGVHTDAFDPHVTVYCDGPSQLPEELISTIWEINSEDGEVDAVPYRGLLVRETIHTDGRVAHLDVLRAMTALSVDHKGFAVFSPRAERDKWAVVLRDGSLHQIARDHVMVCPTSMSTHTAGDKIEELFGAK